METRERVVVALTGAPGTEALIRRAARIVQRAHGELLGVHVSSDEGLVDVSALLDEHRKLLNDMGGEYHEVSGTDVGSALVSFARAENATQLLLGASQRSRWAELLRGWVINRAIRLSGPIDVHVISHVRPDEASEEARRRRIASEPVLPPRRRLAGWCLAAAGVPLLTLCLAQMRDEDDPLPSLLGHLRSVFGLTAAALLRSTGSGGWRVEAAAGESIPERPDDADLVEELKPGVVLALAGARLVAEDQAALNAFAAQLAAVVEHSRLQAEAGRAEALAEANALRSALLQAVFHDLRTPLAAIKASVTSLSQGDVEWSQEQTAEFLDTIDDETDRLTTLVGNLLDMSRIQAGVLRPTLRPVALEEVLPAALASLGPRAAIVDGQISEQLPLVMADAPLLERVLANVIDHAVRFSPPGQTVRVEAGVVAGHLDVWVIDRGSGIAADQHDEVFQPFQRLGDHQPSGGVGLGLAVARGFLTAMDATIDLDDTPGGGTTAVISLPVAP